MSTLKTPTSPRPPKPRRESHDYIEYEKYIDSQVQRTRKNVKLVDLASAMVVLVVALLGFFLTAAVLEHWILPNGLGTIGRIGMFVLLVAGLGHYAWHTLWPLVSRPINPEYAAVAIEREHPSLKNSLINFLLFRTERGKMPPAVFDALEEQAAQRLAQSPIDDAVDRMPLVRWGYVLLGILILGVVYSLASPKSTFDTARRVLMPWSQIATPSRVRITDITPGHVEIIQGDSLEVRAHIRGLAEGEIVYLSYDTADRQHVEQLVPMSPIDEIGTFGTKLPQGEGHAGIQQHLTYRIVAGDGRSIDYQVTALKAPSIRVSEVTYNYPDYTGIDDRTVADRGDIRAIEGTKVTIVAEANGPIESAHLDLDADGTQDIRMKVDGNVATATLDLMLPKERQTPKLSTYQLNMLSTEGVANRKPPQHLLEILPDVVPEIEVLEPAERSREVQLNETVPFRVQASDPDYLLSQVTLYFVKVSDEKVFVQPSLLAAGGPGVDKLDARWEFTASDYELKAGDVVEYWAEARDNCQPEANASITERKELVIVAPAEGQPNPNPNDNRNPQRERGESDNANPQRQQEEGGAGEQDPNKTGEPGNQGEQGKPEKGQPGQDQQNGTDQQRDETGNSEQQETGAEGQGTNDQNRSDQQPGESQTGEQQEGAGAQNQQDPGAQGAGPQDNQQPQEGTGGQNEQPPAGGQPRQGEQRPNEPGSGAGTDSQGSPDGEQQSGSGKGAPNAGERRSVANDGSQDGDALETMNDHLTQEEQQSANRRDATPAERSEQQQRQDRESQGANPEGGQPQGAQPSGEKPADGQGSKTQGSQSQNREGANAEDQKPQQGTGEDPLEELHEKGEAPPEGQNMDADPPAEGAQPRENPGADTAGGKPQQEQSGKGQEPRDGSKSAGGREDGPQGESGRGDEQNPQGSPEAQEDAAPRQKQPDAGPADKSDSDEAPMPGQGKKESDSSGETSGANPGGGEGGSGQDANRDGTGSSGQNDDAEEGGGKSPEQGSGETGTEAGSAEEAGRETGKSGSEAGKGSQQREGEGTKPGDNSNPQRQQGEPGEESQAPGERGEQQAEGGSKPGEKGEQPREPGDKQSDRGEQPGGKSPPKGEPGDRRESSGDNTPNNEKYNLQEADKANLEYARKQTDLVLDTLDRQLKENKVDQELLDKLGWSQEDLRKFVDRWQGLRQKAAEATPEGEAAKVELDNRLRKLGPKRGNVEGETKRTEDTLRDLGEGYESEVPLKFRDKVKRYTEGISK